MRVNGLNACLSLGIAAVAMAACAEAIDPVNYLTGTMTGQTSSLTSTGIPASSTSTSTSAPTSTSYPLPARPAPPSLQAQAAHRFGKRPSSSASTPSASSSSATSVSTSSSSSSSSSSTGTVPQPSPGCTNPTTVTGNGTGVGCFCTTNVATEWNCSNADGCTVTINGTAATCPPTGTNGTLPAAASGQICWVFSGCTESYVGFSFW